MGQPLVGVVARGVGSRLVLSVAVIELLAGVLRRVLLVVLGEVPLGGVLLLSILLLLLLLTRRENWLRKRGGGRGVRPVVWDRQPLLATVKVEM